MTAGPRPAHADRDEWLTVDEVCTELKISRRTFDRCGQVMKLRARRMPAKGKPYMARWRMSTERHQHRSEYAKHFPDHFPERESGPSAQTLQPQAGA